MPVHVLIMVLMLASVLVVGQQLRPGYLYDWLTLTVMVRQWLLPDAYVWNTAAWSISAEMFAYAIVFPAIVMLTRNLRSGVAATLLIAGGWATIGYVLLRFGVIHAMRDGAPLLRVTAGFLIGAGLYRLLGRMPRTVRGDWLLVGGIAFVVVSALAIDAQAPVVFGVMLMIAGSYLGSGPLTSLMARPLPTWLGEVSFSFYLAHIPLLKMGRWLDEEYGLERGALYCVVMLVLNFLAAALLYELIEVPARRRMRNAWERTPAKAGHAPAADALGA